MHPPSPHLTPALTPTLATLRRERRREQEPIRLGVVGVRSIGLNHVACAAETGGVECVAVADRDPTRLRRAADEFGVERCFTDAAELIDRSDVDAVVLAVPNALHAPLAVAALEAGKHVLVEKPIARRVAEAGPMVAARDAADRVLMVGMNMRFAGRGPAFRHAVAAGGIGEVRQVRARWLRRRPHAGIWDRGDWMHDPAASGGGPVLDLGVHVLDLALYLIGMPTVRTVSGHCTRGLGRREALARGKDYAVEDSGWASMRLEGGASLHLEAAYFGNYPHTEVHDVEVIGSEGGLVIGTDRSLLYRGDGCEPEPVEVENPPGASTSCVGHFAAAIRGEQPLDCTAEQAIDVLRVVEALYASDAAGHELTL